MAVSTGKSLKTHEFTMALASPSEMTDELQGALLGAGCDDASLWSEGETVYVTFHREAGSLGEAVGSAIRDVERAGFAVTRVEVDAVT